LGLGTAWLPARRPDLLGDIIFFENASSLNAFKKGNFALAAQASAVRRSPPELRPPRITRTESRIFTATKTGLMYEASVGGQKFG
jgi:hypothetical protein